MNSFENKKELLDMICDEVNVKNIDLGFRDETGKKIVYNREARRFRYADYE
jgi:hypothetical protein